MSKNRKEKRAEKSKEKKTKPDPVKYLQAALLGVQCQLDLITERMNAAMGNRFQFVEVTKLPDNPQITITTNQDSTEVFEVVTSMLGIKEAS